MLMHSYRTVQNPEECQMPCSRKSSAAFVALLVAAARSTTAHVAQEAAQAAQAAAQTRVRPTSLQPPPRYEDLGRSNPLEQERAPAAELMPAATSAAC
jgi:hypothetical protein